MKLHELKPAKGSVKSPLRKGRGIGSGLVKQPDGGTSQKARSGGGVKPGF